MKMTSEVFHTWSHHLRLTPETEALITSIRSSRPIRHVNGHSGNITRRYPSPKMGVSIQFESDRVEFWALYTLERDDDVLEYYEQSSRIPLSYQAKSGRRTTQWHPPDFFVLRRESAGWEEWKQERTLASLAYAKATQVPNVSQSEMAPLPSSLVTTLLAWDGRLWHVEEWGEEVVQLRPEIGEILALPRVQFEHLKQEGSLWIVGEADPSPMTPEVRQILVKAGSKAQRAANQRMIHMFAYARGETTTAPTVWEYPGNQAPTSDDARS